MNTIPKKEFADYITNFKIKDLFLDLGWNNDSTDLPPVAVEDVCYRIRTLADKNGFKILECECDCIPPLNARAKISTEARNVFHENLLIFTDRRHGAQLWTHSYKGDTRLHRTEVRFNIGQDVEKLYQRASGLIFDLDEENNITIIDVTRRVRENFAANAEKLTKKFYEEFKSHYSKFVALIKGINSAIDCEWYASLMLNRLMFCYFLERKGFLDKDRSYLRTKLNMCKKGGKDKFHSFYRGFLLALFHDGLGQSKRTQKTEELLGKIPYLNGGLFSMHEIERKYESIDIPDIAFERIFDLFDKYEWHLDSRECVKGNEINPDVLGYIFEKYINDRASLGAYYTQDDITSYISGRTILTWLLNAVDGHGIAAEYIRKNPDEYIFSDARHGCGIELPERINDGMAGEGLAKKRRDWNDDAAEAYALPTETWREVIERRNGYAETRSFISTTKGIAPSDIIAHNLDIENLVCDILDTIDDPAFIGKFYGYLENIRVLDPSCGSGAFLFAALNVLEPLYERCLSRMEDYAEKGEGDFSSILDDMKRGNHPDKRYFILKKIILNNLYGLDIMREAVETAKLRLFLKLVAMVDPDYSQPNIGLEPLPDIDFNIRSGNGLIGYANADEIERDMQHLSTFTSRDAIRAEMEAISDEIRSFRAAQMDGVDGARIREIKAVITGKLDDLNQKLDENLRKSTYSGIKDKEWSQEYIPFHWIIEFYPIIHVDGGFDVIIGNPPYLEKSQIDYEPKNYATLASKAVHAFFMERAFHLASKDACVGMIVPMALVSTQRMKAVRKILENGRTVFYSNFSWRPAKLFAEVNRALTVFISIPNGKKQYTTKYIKWNSENRLGLFRRLKYTQSSNDFGNSEFWIGKIGSQLDNSILNKLYASKKTLGMLLTKGRGNIFYKSTGGLYWKVFTNFPPKFFANGVKGHSTREKTLTAPDAEEALKITALLSSSTFWLWYTLTSNLRDLNPVDINGFFVPRKWNEMKKMKSLGEEYVKSLKDNSTMMTRNVSTGTTQVQSFKIALSKPIIDKIDTYLAKFYGFTEEELDYIINYDIKYRMSDDSE